MAGGIGATDGLSAAADKIVATADSDLDRVAAWFNLARTIVSGHIPEARLVELAGE